MKSGRWDSQSIRPKQTTPHSLGLASQRTIALMEAHQTRRKVATIQQSSLAVCHSPQLERLRKGLDRRAPTQREFSGLRRVDSMIAHVGRGT
jgi:hypothetical protein